MILLFRDVVVDDRVVDLKGRTTGRSEIATNHRTHEPILSSFSII